jgi:hypothetical protein
MENGNLNYTIPSDNRELQLQWHYATPFGDYTIPSDNRELQLTGHECLVILYYTIPGSLTVEYQEKYLQVL